MKVGGYDKHVDSSKLGGAVIIGACVVLAVRTARWPVTVRRQDAPDNDLWRKVGYFVRLALEVMTRLKYMCSLTYATFLEGAEERRLARLKRAQAVRTDADTTPPLADQPA